MKEFLEEKDYGTDKGTFVMLLQGTNRKGVADVLDGLEKLGFYTAPASSRHHLSESGGLLKHSLNVYYQAWRIREDQVDMQNTWGAGLGKEEIPDDSLIIVSLLHDVCKADVYKQVEKFRKDAQGRWEKYLAYEYDASRCPLGHGEKSVIRLMRMGLELKPEEIAAIRWHMAGWDLSDSREARDNFSAACDKYPLLSVLIAADELATRITERKKENK